MFRTIVSRIGRDPDYPARAFTLDVLGRVLDGALYDHLPCPFHEEVNDAGEYVPVRRRRPSVRFNLCRTVVDDAVSLLFSEGRFPTPVSEDQQVQGAASSLIREAFLARVMQEAATIGSVGSVAIHMAVLRQADGSCRVDYRPRSTQFLTPTFDPADPTRLVRLVERYKVRGADLDPAYGAPQRLANASFWFRREWDGEAETWFLPQLAEAAEKGEAPRIDEDRTVRHQLGFVPWVWVKNLPGALRLIGPADGPAAISEVDGACTFAGAIELMIEIDYQLSQAGRGLKYSMDPTLVLKEPARAWGGEGEVVKGPANALVVDAEKGDAKMLEIGGEAFTVVLDYVRALRELGLEAIHGARADPQKLAAAQSGRAMELMNQPLVWLADRLRISYGEGALARLIAMTFEAARRYPIVLPDGTALPKGVAAPVTLAWPDWYPATAADRQAEAITLKTLGEAGLMSRASAVRSLSAEYDIEDVGAELKRIEADIASASQVIEAQHAQPKPAEAAPV